MLKKTSCFQIVVQSAWSNDDLCFKTAYISISIIFQTVPDGCDPVMPPVALKYVACIFRVNLAGETGLKLVMQGVCSYDFGSWNDQRKVIILSVSFYVVRFVFQPYSVHVRCVWSVGQL